MITGLCWTDAGAEDRLEILVPPEHLSIRSDHLYLVGKTTAPLVEVALNGETIREVVPRDSVFHTLLTFGYGLNEVTVTPVYSEGRGTSEAIEFISGPDVAGKYRHLFERYEFHGDSPPDMCLSCHRPAADTLSRMGDAESCYGCHTLIIDRFRSHIPNNERSCVICHQLSNDLTHASAATRANGNPCYSCHEDKVGQFNQDYIHGPVAGNSCTICHNPHGSIFEKNLVSPIPVLCPSCHAQEQTRAMRVQHRPYENGQCGACHDPHSTSHKWVLIKRSQELCVNCHEDIGSLKNHNHPYNVEPKKELATPLKLTDKGRLECLSCHDSHAGNTEHLLRTDTKNEDICSGCHPDR